MMDRTRSLPWRAIGGMTALVSLSSVVGLVIVAIDHQEEEITSLQSTSQANAETTRINQEAAELNRQSVDELAGVVRQLQDQLRESGEEPVVPQDPSDLVRDAPEPVPPADDQGVSTIVTRPPSEAEMRAVASDVIRDNPSFISGQVAAAVTGYFVRNPPPAGPPGADGDPASPEQIAAAVATFCAGDTSPCTGPQGNDGPPGPAGIDGQPGGQGPQGDPGRGIESVECTPEGTWRVTYTNPPEVVTLPNSDCIAEAGPPGIPGTNGTNGTNGISITSVDLEGTAGTTCTLVITYSEGEPDRLNINPLVCPIAEEPEGE